LENHGTVKQRKAEELLKSSTMDFISRVAVPPMESLAEPKDDEVEGLFPRSACSKSSNFISYQFNQVNIIDLLKDIEVV